MFGCIRESEFPLLYLKIVQNCLKLCLFVCLKRKILNRSVELQMAVRKTRLQSHYRKGLGRGNSGEYGPKFRAKPGTSRRRLRRRRRPVARARSRHLLLRRSHRQMQDFDGLNGRRALPSTHQEAKALFHPGLPRTSQTGVMRGALSLASGLDQHDICDGVAVECPRRG